MTIPSQPWVGKQNGGFKFARKSLQVFWKTSLVNRQNVKTRFMMVLLQEEYGPRPPIQQLYSPISDRMALDIFHQHQTT